MSATLTPVAQSGFWRVKIAWPNTGPHASPHIGPRYFGKFETKAKADKWIAEHRWLTEQRQPASGDYPEGTNGC